MTDNIIYSFAPLVQADSEILFLGSAPSVLSRQNQFFYGNPTNHSIYRTDEDLIAAWRHLIFGK